MLIALVIGAVLTVWFVGKSTKSLVKALVLAAVLWVLWPQFQRVDWRNLPGLARAKAAQLVSYFD